ncbi:hypothetical protein Tsubulata_014394 [Turnera subulata]|uniref:RING-type domain-containing protein n=1 Tax=Turnera subulata TaxID=218843 RepID=A0A9Q0JPC8_9ROSI|nr:hypothetical protein Tsubulata_014394 [Turnera subulata]
MACLDLIFSHLQWALNFFQTQQILVPEIGTEIDISYHTKVDQPTECAVCLCKVEEGEEIRELRCNHIFHRVCLDRWIEYRHSTCPLCRESIPGGYILEKTEMGRELTTYTRQVERRYVSGWR